MKSHWILGVLFAVFVAGCSGPKSELPPETEPITSDGIIHIGGLGKSVHPFWEQVEQGMKAGVQDGQNLEFYVPSREDAQKQAEKIKSWVGTGKDIIIFAASDPQAVGPAIKDAMARDIVCVAMDTDAPDSGRSVYVGTDNYNAGRKAGEEMGRLLGGRGKVCIATGSITASNSIQRMEGFRDAIKDKYPNILVLSDVLVDNEDRATAVQKAKAKLAAVPDIAGFYGVYALNGPACANAVKSAGKVGKVRIVCFDTLPEHMNMLKSGEIDAAIGQRPYLMGKRAVEVAIEIYNEGPQHALEKANAKDGVVDTGVDVVTKATMEDYRKQLKGLGIPVEGW